MTGGSVAQTAFVHRGRQNQQEIRFLYSCFNVKRLIITALNSSYSVMMFGLHLEGNFIKICDLFLTGFKKG